MYLKKYIVTVSATDLRKEPQKAKTSRQLDPLQESQLLKGECFLGHHPQDGWVFGHAIEQPFFHKIKGWIGYPGWIEQHHLEEVELFPDPSCNTLNEHNLSEVNKRKRILSFAKSFLAAPYHWGGRTPYNPNFISPLTSVDCSGLVNFAYKEAGITVPRNAHDQYLAANPIPFQEMQIGDLIFTSKGPDFSRVTHVMLFIEHDLLIEATTETMNIRITEGLQKLGKKIQELENGMVIQNKKISCGSLLIPNNHHCENNRYG